ncbi:MAG: oligoendopeptidase F, partial [Candidatus Electrothrix sp. AR5]|nr:oligoendopeptidase F [Candidatus Electrothrix sp. AR5]
MSTQRNTELNTTEVLWNLTDLYDSLEDEMIQDDLDFCHQEADLLQETQGQLAELDPATFARTVKRLERVQINLGRIETYAFLNFSTQVKNAEA